VTGTDADAQGYTRQVATLRAAGVIVARSNAEAARLAARIPRASRARTVAKRQGRIPALTRERKEE
jgi:hypothetical protein